MASIAEQVSERKPVREFHVRTEHIEKLIAGIQRADDPELRATALELLQCVIELHGAALDRLLAALRKTEAGEQALALAVEDDLVSSVLLLHELHPDDLETRVLRALEKVRPQLDAHGANAELLSAEGGNVRVRLYANGGGCHSPGATLKSIIEETVVDCAPDIKELLTEIAETLPKLVILK